ncbi:hypothetical protein KSP39_PZI001086 [Platanthera zijinensis]|uniref:Reverse transcriptase domain-containing protein n=1 Tax=Platanthera zijinensis TaxID=2320716 RepID=A0AAP0GFT5_9ASPA
MDFFREAARGTPTRSLTSLTTSPPSPRTLSFQSAPPTLQSLKLHLPSSIESDGSLLLITSENPALKCLSDALKCKLLVTTLDGQAREWFYELPLGTISSFAKLRSELLLRFATSKKRKYGPAALFDIKQRDNESVARFVDRFQKEIQGVRNVNPDYYKVALIHGLREGPLKFKARIKAPSTYQELIVMVNRFIEGENANPTYISSLTAKAEGRDASNSYSYNHHHNKPPRPDFHPHSQRGRNLRHKKPFIGHQQFLDQRLPLDATPAVPLQTLPILQNALPAPRPHENSSVEELADLGFDIEEVVQIIQRKSEEKRQGPQRELLVEGKIKDLGKKSDFSKPSTSKGKEVAEVQLECVEIEDVGRLEPINVRPECFDADDEGALGRLFYIHGGAGTEATCKSSIARVSRAEVASSSSSAPSGGDVSFGQEDLPQTANPFDDAVVFKASIEDYTVDRILINTGSSVNLLFKSTFEALSTGKPLLSTKGMLYGFSGERKEVKGSVTLSINLGGAIKPIQFIVVDAPSFYHAIFGRPLLNKYQAVVSTYHLAIKFYADGRLCRVRSNPRHVRECYLRTVNMIEIAPLIFPAAAEASSQSVAAVDSEGVHLEPSQVTQGVPIAEGEERKLSINSELPEDQKAELISCLLKNLDVFAWAAEDMSGIDPDVACHHLNVDPNFKPVQQKKRDVATKLADPIREEVSKILKANFIREIQYPTWISNIVMVKKPGGKWRMCVDFTRLNKVCPKDFYPLPRIDSLVDSVVGYSLMSFLDAFSGYHQIRMHKLDVAHTSFITNDGCYCYLVMPFGLKNVGATYQRMMDHVFKEQKGRNLEVYVDDLLVKSKSFSLHLQDLAETFSTLCRYKMKLNPSKCTFGESKGKFLCHLLTPEGLAPNPNKVKAILDMAPPRSPKEVQQLGGRLAGLGRFISRVGGKSASFFKTLRGASKFQWTEECSQAFEQLKRQLTSTPLLQSPRSGEMLFLCLGVGLEPVRSVLVREENRRQFPVYYVSHILKDVETRYPILEKLALALVMSARRLRPYFQAHSVQVVTDQPLKIVLEKPEHSGRTAIKAQVLADFLIDTTESISDQAERSPLACIIYVDGASGRNSSRAGVFLINPNDIKLKQAIMFYFPVTNNQEEYEALLASLRLTRELGIDHVYIKNDSLVMASQVLGNFETRESVLKKCVSEEEATVVLQEVHSGECGSHSGARNLEKRILWQGYFLPTMKKDSEAYARTCVQCQKFAPLQHQAAQSLRSITTPWPFTVWGMDLIGPFHMASGQRRFIIVMIDYFSK